MSGTVRFVHTADLHLGAPFGSVAAEDASVRRALSAAPFEALTRVVETCIARRADFLVIAGDVFHDPVPPLPVRSRFVSAMTRLAEAGIPVYVVNGNHDPAGSAPPAGLPRNVRYFSTSQVERVEVYRGVDRVCALYGRGYARREEPEDLAAGYERRPDDGVAIGVLHTNVGGRPDDGSYAPCNLQTLVAAKMDYWALGHIHMPEQVLETPRIRYAGCIQGLNPKETGPRGCWVVTIANGLAAEEFVETDSVRWAAPEADISGATDEQGVFVQVCEACDRARARAEGRPTVVRVKLTGRSAAHRVLLRPGRLEQLLEAAREDQLRGADWVWVDRIEDASRSELDLESLRGADNFVGELIAIAEGYAGDGAAAALVAAQTDPVVARFRVDGFEPDPASVLSRALDLCLDGLAGEEE